MKRILFALLLAPLFFTACNKDDNGSSASEFVINGIVDVNMATNNVLAVGVAQSSGAQLPVELSVSGLPSGITAAIAPANGTPAFASVITFLKDNTAVEGTYPIKITGKSSVYTKSYDLNLVVPQSNFFKFNNTKYSVDNVGRMFNSGYSYLFATNTANNARTSIAFASPTLPTSNGNYNIVKNASASNEVQLICSIIPGISYYSDGIDGKVAKVIVNNGKITVSFSDVLMKDQSGNTTNASVYLSE